MTGTQSQPRPEEAQPLKRIEFLVLAVLRDGPLHGYGMVQEVAQRTRGGVQIRPGSLYRVLDRLMGRGLLELAKEDSPQDDRRTDYRITDMGRAAVLAEAHILASMTSAIVGGS